MGTPSVSHIKLQTHFPALVFSIFCPVTMERFPPPMKASPSVCTLDPILSLLLRDRFLFPLFSRSLASFKYQIHIQLITVLAILAPECVLNLPTCLNSSVITVIYSAIIAYLNQLTSLVIGLPISVLPPSNPSSTEQPEWWCYNACLIRVQPGMNIWGRVCIFCWCGNYLLHGSCFLTVTLPSLTSSS